MERFPDLQPLLDRMARRQAAQAARDIARDSARDGRPTVGWAAPDGRPEVGWHDPLLDALIREHWDRYHVEVVRAVAVKRADALSELAKC